MSWKIRVGKFRARRIKADRKAKQNYKTALNFSPNRVFAQLKR